METEAQRPLRLRGVNRRSKVSAVHVQNALKSMEIEKCVVPLGVPNEIILIASKEVSELISSVPVGATAYKRSSLMHDGECDDEKGLPDCPYRSDYILTV